MAQPDGVDESSGPAGARAERTCAEPSCGTVLSIYNEREFCAFHQPMIKPRTRGREI